MRRHLRFAAGLIAALPAFAGALPAHRVYDGWESCRIGGGGYLQHAAFTRGDTNRIYLATDVGGCYRSDDAGRSWRMLHGALPSDDGTLYQVRGVCAHQQKPDTVLFAAGDGWRPLSGIWKSDDGGRRFRKVFDGAYAGNGDSRIGGSVLLNAPDGGETVFTCAMGKGVYRSDDFGETWTFMGLDGVDPLALVPDMTNPSRFWFVARRGPKSQQYNGKAYRHGLFLTEDGGKTWAQVNDTDKLIEMVQDPKDATLLHGAFRDTPPLKFSRDGGRTWSPYANASIHPKPTDQFHDGYCQALCTGPDFVLAGCSGGAIYRLSTGSMEWVKVKPDKVDFGDWYGIKCPGLHPFGACLGWIGVSPHDPARWYFTDWYAMYVSPDAGRTWEISIDGIEMTVVHTLAQDPKRPERIYCGMADVGAFRSDNGGVSFDKWYRGTLHDNVKCMATCASDGDTVYAIGPKAWGWTANCLNASHDGGEKWTRPAMRGLPDMDGKNGARMSTLAIRPEYSNEVYVVVSGRCEPGKGGVYVSADGGDSFKWIGEGLPQKELFADVIWFGGGEIACCAGGGLVVVSSKTGEAYSRLPGADSWRPAEGLPAGAGKVVSDALIAGRFYKACGKKGLYRSDDGGCSWCCVREGFVSAVCTDLACAGRVACREDDIYFWSENGGTSWRRVPGKPPRPGGIAFAGGRLFVATGGSGVFRSMPLADIRQRDTQ